MSDKKLNSHSFHFNHPLPLKTKYDECWNLLIYKYNQCVFFLLCIVCINSIMITKWKCNNYLVSDKLFFFSNFFLHKSKNLHIRCRMIGTFWSFTHPPPNYLNLLFFKSDIVLLISSLNFVAIKFWRNGQIHAFSSWQMTNALTNGKKFPSGTIPLKKMLQYASDKFINL
jgi:hypothetical protein